ncbi:MAG: hypothetical protein QG635_1752 [Bacteroidota bacterium]|nr:hypothetical protein [Bacteroidota bacterium]
MRNKLIILFIILVCNNSCNSQEKNNIQLKKQALSNSNDNIINNLFGRWRIKKDIEIPCQIVGLTQEESEYLIGKELIINETLVIDQKRNIFNNNFYLDTCSSPKFVIEQFTNEESEEYLLNYHSMDRNTLNLNDKDEIINIEIEIFSNYASKYIPYCSLLLINREYIIKMYEGLYYKLEKIKNLGNPLKGK